MPDFPYHQALLKDPLSEETRKERRSLLAVSALGIVMVKTGLIPTKIAALGVEFSQTDRNTLLYALAVIVLYFLLAFFLYSLTDYWTYRIENYVSELKDQDRRIELLKKIIERTRNHIDTFEVVTPELKKVVTEFEQLNQEIDTDIGIVEAAIKNKSLRSELPEDMAAQRPNFKFRADDIKSRYTELESKLREIDSGKREIRDFESELHDNEVLAAKVKIATSLRLIFEFALPIVIGTYAAITLFIGR